MFGAATIDVPGFRSILVQLSLAKAALLESNAIAKKIVERIQNGAQIADRGEAADERRFLQHCADQNEDACFAALLYNMQSGAKDRLESIRNTLASALAYVEAHRPFEGLQKSSKNVRERPIVRQVVTGNTVRNAGRNFVEVTPKKPK